MSKETIYREDAIKALRSTVAQYVPFLNGINMTLPLECETALRSVPSADRPSGEWIFVESKISDRKLKKCSVCGLGYVSLKPDNYCPNCGAKMKGADDETNLCRCACQ